MNDNQSKEIESLIELLKSAKSDPSVLEKISKDPIGILQSLNIHVEDELKDAVISQFEAISSTISHDAHNSQRVAMSAKASAPLPPTNVTIETGKAEAAVPPEVLEALEFKIAPWGFVLIAREPAIKYLEGGGTITASALGGIAALAGLGGLAAATGVLAPLGITVAVITGIIAAILGITSGIITIADEGNGVYLTWTWAQVLPFLNITNLPVITPIK